MSLSKAFSPEQSLRRRNTFGSSCFKAVDCLLESNFGCGSLGKYIPKSSSLRGFNFRNKLINFNLGLGPLPNESLFVIELQLLRQQCHRLVKVELHSAEQLNAAFQVLPRQILSAHSLVDLAQVEVGIYYKNLLIVQRGFFEPVVDKK